MHVVFATRGHIDWVRPFIEDLSTRYFPYKKYDPNTKQLVPVMLKARLCPIQLWDYSFPEENLDAVLNTLFQGSDGKGVRTHLNLQKYLGPIRKVMKLKKIPDTYDKSQHLVMVDPQHIEVIGIGIKEDNWLTEDGRTVSKKDKTEFSEEGI